MKSPPPQRGQRSGSAAEQKPWRWSGFMCVCVFFFFSVKQGGRRGQEPDTEVKWLIICCLDITYLSRQFVYHLLTDQFNLRITAGIFRPCCISYLVYFVYILLSLKPGFTRWQTKERGDVDGPSSWRAGRSYNKHRPQGPEQGGRGHVTRDATP